MVMRLFPVVRATAVPIGTIVTGRIAHKPMGQRFVSFLVPFKMTDHFLLLDKDTRMAIEAVEVLSAYQSHHFRLIDWPSKIRLKTAEEEQQTRIELSISFFS